MDRSNWFKSSLWVLVSIPISFSPIVQAEKKPLEEVTITGSHIKQSPSDAASPVSVMDQDKLSVSPNIATMLQDLNFSSGTENQTNQFSSNATVGTANINLRGLGLDRTLVLLNGRRQVVAAMAANDGASFVDIANFPSIALDRVEILKDGAAAIYGSDAVAGVANFITRTGFEGFEVEGAYKNMEDGNGDYDFGAIWGVKQDDGNWMVAMNFLHRSEVQNNEKNFTDPVVDIPELNLTLYGQSSFGNPGSFLALDGNQATATPTIVRDPQCADVGGIATATGGGTPLCGFQYIGFSNMSEKEDRFQLFSSFDFDISDRVTLFGEMLFSSLEIPDWKTSPSYPPVVSADPSRFIPGNHPGLLDAVANLGLTNETATNAFDNGALFIGRPVGVAGPSETGRREHSTVKSVAGVDVEIGDTTDFSVSLNYSSSEAEVATSDTLTSRYSAALLGLGGPNCTGNTPGANGCEYFNPFSSAITSDDPSLTNSDALLNWLTGTQVVNTNVSELIVLDGLLTGEGPVVGVEPMGYALGFQYREDSLEVEFNDLADLSLNPGANGEGLFAFLRGGTEGKIDEDVVAVFGELGIQPRDDVDVQLAIRYEDYGGNIGDSIDPKIAARWAVNDTVILRGSLSSTFRGPSLIQTQLTNTALELIGSALAFKAVDRVGNPDLEPEKANTFNMGVIWDPIEDLTVSLDLWRFDFKDPIVRESPNDLVALCPTPDAGNAFCDQITFSGDSIARIQTRYVNGPNIDTTGLDLSTLYTMFLPAGEFFTGVDVTYVNEYKIDSFLGNDGFDAAGRLNANTFVRSMPQLKGNLFFGYSQDSHYGRVVFRYVDEYVDDGLNVLKSTPGLSNFVTETTIDDHLTVDLFYQLSFNVDKTKLQVNVINLFNEDPPPVRADLRYDARTHSPLGRIIAMSMSHAF